MISQQNIRFLFQCITTLEDAVHRLEDAYFKNDREEFDKMNKFILEIKSKIDAVVK